MRWLINALRPGLDFILPPACPICGKSWELSVCPDCTESLRRSEKTLVKRVENLVIIAPFRYDKPIPGLIQSFKYEGLTHLAQFMAPFMARQVKKYAPDQSFKGIVPVPLHPAKARQRGFSQTVLLASALAELLELPVLPWLARIRYTEPQVELDEEDRLGNVVGAFKYKGPGSAAGPVLLLDDVATTGATMSEARKNLPVQDVLGICFALSHPDKD